MEGRLLLYTRNWIKSKIEVMHNIEKEGAVTQVIYQFGLVIWSTPKKIRVIHYKRNRQKICMIPVPEANPNIPQDLYYSNLTKPHIQIKVNHENRSRIADPDVEMYIAWFNEIKKVNLEYKQRIDAFDATTQFTKDMGNKFIVGMNNSVIKDKYIFIDFEHEP